MLQSSGNYGSGCPQRVRAWKFMFPMRLLPPAALIAAWWLFTSVIRVFPAYMLPSPEAVLMYAVKAWRDGSLGDAVFSSAARMSLGFLLGSTIGVALAVVVGSSRLAAGLLEPLAKFFQAVAGPTWIPLAVLWFGMGWVSVSFIIFNTVFFLVFYNTLMGIRTVNQTLVNAVLTLGGRRWDVLREVLIPGSVQGMMVGLRIGIGYGWRALIAAEMIASGRGLGVLIWEGGRYFAISRIFVGLLLIGLISFVLDKAMAQLEEHTLGRWGMLNRV